LRKSDVLKDTIDRPSFLTGLAELRMAAPNPEGEVFF